MKLSDVTPFLNYTFSSESELIKAISLISHNFTKERDSIGEYVSDKKMVAAYTCFYLLTNLPKLKKVFEKTEIDISKFSDYEFIDIGAGPGTFTLSLLELNKDLKITALENSKLMIEQGEKLVKGLYPNCDFDYFSSVKSIPMKKKKRFGVFGHSANEMSNDFILKTINELELDIILFIEPGTKEFFRKSLILRDKLCDKFHLHYPCYSSSNCPLSEDDWCHQYLKVKHEVDVERLTQLVQKDRRKLPIIINLYSTNDKIRNDSARIVRVYKPTKFSLEWQICQKNSDQNKVRDLQILTRSFKKKELKELGEILAGDKVQFDVEKELEDNKVRGKLKWKKNQH